MQPPELLLSCTQYGEGADMWSVACVIAEMIQVRDQTCANGVTIIQILLYFFSSVATKMEGFALRRRGAGGDTTRYETRTSSVVRMCAAAGLYY